MVELSSLSILWEPWLYVLGEIGGYQAVALAVPVTLSMLILGALTYFLLRFIVLKPLLEHAGGGGDDKTVNWVVGIITVAITFLSLYSGAALILAGILQAFGFVYAFLIFFVLMIGLLLVTWKWGKGVKGGDFSGGGLFGGGSAAGGGLFGGGSESSTALDESATETGEVADEAVEAGLEEQNIAADAQIENIEAVVLKEEQKKFQTMKAIRMRISYVLNQGVDAPDPQYGSKGATIRAVLVSFLKNIISICTTEIKQVSKIIQLESLNMRRTKIEAAKEAHEIALEKREIKDENIMNKKILKGKLGEKQTAFKQLYQKAESVQKRINAIEKSRINFKNKELKLEKKKQTLEKLEKKYTIQFEKNLVNTEKEAKFFHNFLANAANKNPKPIKNEYKKLDKWMLAGANSNVNFLKEQYQLLNTEYTKLTYRHGVLKENLQLENAIVYRDLLLARIHYLHKGNKFQKLESKKELNAEKKMKNLTKPTKDLIVRCEKQIAKIKIEVTNAQKELQAAQRELAQFKSIAI